MHHKRKIILAVFSSLSILILILDSKTALNSAAEGLEQCIRTVIPALLPFFVFSTLLTNFLTGSHIPILAILFKKLHIPSGAENIFLIGLLGGYPVGAISIHQECAGNNLSPTDAKRMLGYCVNVGPSFIFGICSTLFSDPRIPWYLWAIHIVSAFVVGTILPGKRKSLANNRKYRSISLPDALRISLFNMAQVCGWIVICRVWIGIFDKWVLWLMPGSIRCLLIGSLELTNGCLALSSIHSEELRFILCSAMLALGGLCVAMQVYSAVGEIGLGMYLPGKLLQCLISILLAVAVQNLLIKPHLSLQDAHVPALLISMLTVALIPFCSFYKKRGRNFTQSHV